MNVAVWPGDDDGQFRHRRPPAGAYGWMVVQFFEKLQSYLWARTDTTPSGALLRRGARPRTRNRAQLDYQGRSLRGHSSTWRSETISTRRWDTSAGTLGATARIPFSPRPRQQSAIRSTCNRGPSYIATAPAAWNRATRREFASSQNAMDGRQVHDYGEYLPGRSTSVGVLRRRLTGRHGALSNMGPTDAVGDVSAEFGTF